VANLQIDFNTVGLRYIRDLLTSLLSEIGSPEHERIGDRPNSPQDELGELPLKFLNALCVDALLPGEQVEAIVFQPTIRPRFFRRDERDGILCAVTGLHVLLIREPLSLLPYGEVFTFCPRSRLREARVMERGNGIELQLFLGSRAHLVSARFALEYAEKLRAAIHLLPYKEHSFGNTHSTAPGPEYM
jgi:hypothetical protein